MTSTLLSDDPGAAAQSSPTLAYVGGELASSWRDDRGGNGNVRARRTPGDHFAYTYDGLNRLTRVNLLNAESFALDGASNVTNRSGVAETYDAANRLKTDGGTTNVWTNADQLDLRGSDNFDYDALDRLISSTIGGSARGYEYNGDGLLKSRTGAGATSFLWDPTSSPSRLLTQGSDRIVYGLGPLYVVKVDGSTLTFARDGGKSVRAEVNGGGTVTASFRYKAYGQTAQSFGATVPTYLGYAGQLLDASGLYYMRARWYDGTTGRFTTRDPVSPTAATPSFVNAYGYAMGNPLVFTDPSGHCVFCRVLWDFVSTHTVGVEASTAYGIGPFYRSNSLAVVHSPDGTVSGLATHGEGQGTGLTISISPRVVWSDAQTGSALRGVFKSTGGSVGEVLQVSWDMATGIDPDTGDEVNVYSAGPGLGVDFSAIFPFAWEFHAAITDTIVQLVR